MNKTRFRCNCTAYSKYTRLVGDSIYIILYINVLKRAMYIVYTYIRGGVDDDDDFDLD